MRKGNSHHCQLTRLPLNSPRPQFEHFNILVFYHSSNEVAKTVTHITQYDDAEYVKVA